MRERDVSHTRLQYCLRGLFYKRLLTEFLIHIEMVIPNHMGNIYMRMKREMLLIDSMRAWAAKTGPNMDLLLLNKLLVIAAMVGVTCWIDCPQSWKINKSAKESCAGFFA